MACVNKLKQAHTCNHYILHLLLMTDTSTPKLLHTSSRIYSRADSLSRGDRNSGRRLTPSRLTIAFIRQFASVYHVTPLLPDGCNGVVLN